MQHRFKNLAKLSFVFAVFAAPLLAQAACSTSGYTVVYINGIQTNEHDASIESSKLGQYLGLSFNNQVVTTILAHNETHGLDEDAAETTLPQLAQHDIDDILMNLERQVQTRKIVIVGFSEGAMIANRLYNYLIAHGEPANAIAIYGVATPETILQNRGSYLNYQGDNVIYNSILQVGAVVPPPYNISVKEWNADPNAHGDNVGHNFVTTYLDNFAGRMTSEIQAEMFTLRATGASTDGACFEAPADTLSHKTSGVLLAVAKPASIALNAAAAIGWNGIIGSVAFLSDTTTAIENFFWHPKSQNTAANNRALNDAAFGLLKAVGASSLGPKQVDQLQRGENPGLGAAAILAFSQDDEATTTGEVLGEATDTAPVATTTIPFPTAPAAMPGENVHYNAPAFGGTAAADSSPAPAATLTTPTVTFSNWTVSSDARLCDSNPRYVDIVWSAPGATYYDVYTQDVASQASNLFETTHDTGTLSFPVPITVNSLLPTNLIVVAHNDTGDAATTTVRIDQAIPDSTPPSLLDALLSPTIFAANVPVTSNIIVPFNESLAPSTITANAFILSRVGDATRTDVGVALSADSTTVTMTPTQPLQYASRYNISIGCTVSDVYGNRLSNGIGLVLDSSSQYFTTEADPSAATSTP